MAKIAIIKQTAGLGDILFTSKIRKLLENDGYKVYNPVINEYEWIHEYVDGNFPTLNNFNYLEFFMSNNLNPTKTIVGDDEFFFIPLQSADRHFSCSVMDAKYKLINIEFSDWSDYMKYKRDTIKEENLLTKLNISENEEFILVNNKYGSPPNFAIKQININSDSKIINMDFYENFTLFDWIGVMERAKEIHVVESSINFLLEKENIDPNKVFIYSKHTPSSFSQVKHLFSKKWNYVY